MVIIPGAKSGQENVQRQRGQESQGRHSEVINEIIGMINWENYGSYRLTYRSAHIGLDKENEEAVRSNAGDKLTADDRAKIQVTSFLF